MKIFINGQLLVKEREAMEVNHDVKGAWKPLYRTSIITACIINLCFSFILHASLRKQTNKERMPQRSFVATELVNEEMSEKKMYSRGGNFKNDD